MVSEKIWREDPLDFFRNLFGAGLEIGLGHFCGWLVRIIRRGIAFRVLVDIQVQIVKVLKSKSYFQRVFILYSRLCLTFSPEVHGIASIMSQSSDFSPDRVPIVAPWVIAHLSHLMSLVSNFLRHHLYLFVNRFGAFDPLRTTAHLGSHGFFLLEELLRNFNLDLSNKWLGALFARVPFSDLMLLVVLFISYSPPQQRYLFFKRYDAFVPGLS